MDNINDFNVNLDDAATCLLQPANCLPMVTALDRFHCTTYIFKFISEVLILRISLGLF